LGESNNGLCFCDFGLFLFGVAVVVVAGDDVTVVALSFQVFIADDNVEGKFDPEPPELDTGYNSVFTLTAMFPGNRLLVFPVNRFVTVFELFVIGVLAVHD